MNCHQCGQEFKVQSTLISNYGRRYCSEACSDIGRRRGVTKTCPVCNEQFHNQTNREKDGKGTFCSLRCYRRGRDTKPERMAAEWMSTQGIAYESQVNLGVGFVDFYIPSSRTVVEVDGDYWHSRPKQISIDRRRDAFHTSRGYRVVRIKEQDIYLDLEQAMGAI